MSEVITIGEAMILFIADKEGELSESEHFTRHIAGADVNVAIGLARLGHSISLISQVGNDPFGKYIKSFLKKEKINIENVLTTQKYPTGFMIKGKAKNGNPETAYFRKGAAASHLTKDIVKKIDFTGTKILHLGGIFSALSEEAYETTLEIIKKARDHNLLITFDPNLRPSLWEDENTMIERTNNVAFLSDVILPNIKEGKILTGKQTKEEMTDFYLKHGAKQVIINLVDNGAYSKRIDANGKIVETVIQSFIPKKIVDRVGAGDGFVAGVIAGLLEDLPDDKLLTQGNAIGIIQMQHISDNEGLPTRSELDQFIEENLSIKNH